VALFFEENGEQYHQIPSSSTATGHLRNSSNNLHQLSTRQRMAMTTNHKNAKNNLNVGGNNGRGEIINDSNRAHGGAHAN